MTIALWCLFIAAQLHFVSKIPLIMAQAKCTEGYDNNNPRAQQDSLEGWGRRALAIHQNQLESFPFFAAGILVVIALGITSQWVDIVAITYLVSRVVYMLCYLKNWGMMRSTVWAVGFTCSVMLMIAPIWA